MDSESFTTLALPKRRERHSQFYPEAPEKRHPPPRSSLSLFVSWIDANDANNSLSLDDLALVANSFHRCSDFHALLSSIHDPPPTQIVGREFHRDFISGQDLDEMHSHFSGNMCKHPVPVAQFDPEHGIWQCLHDRSFNGNHLFFGHSTSFPEDPFRTAMPISLLPIPFS